MKRCGILIALAMIAGIPASGNADEFSYSYLEVMADLSRTKNTAASPLEDDADGRFFGVTGSLEVLGAFYVRGTWSRETKDFSNEVAHTPLDLDSDQRMTALGAGYHYELGERTSVYAEVLYLVDFQVEHSVPLLVPSQFGPPTVTTTDSTIEGDGFSATLGMRRLIGAKLELEGQLARIHSSADVIRTGNSISDSETMLKVGARLYADSGFSIGVFSSYSRHTDDNFNNIRKIGVSLRYDF